MKELLWKILKFQNILLKNTSLKNKRYLYDNIPDKQKLVGIVGLRGVWKTTILLQKLKESEKKDESLYFSMDNPKIISIWLFNLIEKFYFDFGYKNYYIDEIHKYNNWNQELKNIYDSFPDIKILFSWSSSIDIIKWTYDLSRRVILLKIGILSFREFLEFRWYSNLEKFSLDEILKNDKNIIDKISKINIPIIKEFQEYLKYWEFPFFLESEKFEFNLKLENIINKLIYEDIAIFYSLKTNNLQYFKQIIYFIINSKPWLFSFDSLAKTLKIWWDTLKNYIRILEEIWLLKIMEFDWNITQKIRKSKKIYFMINNINYLSSYSSFDNIRRMRESLFMSNILNYSNVYDYLINILYSCKWFFAITKNHLI